MGSEPFSAARTAQVQGDSRSEAAQPLGALGPGAGTPPGRREPVSVQPRRQCLSEDCLLRVTSTGRDSQVTAAPRPSSPASAWPDLGRGSVVPTGS